MWPDDLPRSLESEHFILRFADRIPTRGRGFGAGGVRDRGLIHTYLDTLETAYEILTRPPHSRLPPLVGPAGKTEVHVFDLHLAFPTDPRPFTTIDPRCREDVPVICLPCRTDFPTRESEALYARAAAVHEFAHALNCRERPLTDPHSGSWEWLDEGTAFHCEHLVLPNNQDSLRFLLEWVDRPESPLDDYGARFQTGMFVRYLTNSQGPHFLTRLWMESAHEETALAALTRHLGNEETVFSTPDPDISDFFGTGYCLDSYFFFDPANPLYTPEVHNRFGTRSISESFLVFPGESLSTRDFLAPLSCRYYRVALGSGSQCIRIRILPGENHHPFPLRGHLTVVTPHRRRGPTWVLRPTPGDAAEGPALLAELTDLDADKVDHLILTVSLGVLPEGRSSKRRTEEGLRYEVQVSGSSRR
jgi:hypothetical protein